MAVKVCTCYCHKNDEKRPKAVAEVRRKDPKYGYFRHMFVCDGCIYGSDIILDGKGIDYDA
jgi:hypothetical protein